ncbi:MAG: hypothetical protein WCR42_01825 [bacterium]
MGLSSEMKNLSEEIVAQFKQRLKENEELVNDVQKTLDGFRKDHLEMAAVLNANAKALKKDLAINEKERLKESDLFMKQMIKEHKEMSVALRETLDHDEETRLDQFDSLMKSINDKISEIFAYTDNMLTQSEVDRLSQFVELMKNINEEITDIFTYTDDLLAKSEVERLNEFTLLMKNINKEILRIFTYTHNMLMKGEVERLKDFNHMMKGIQTDVKNLKKAMAELIGDYSKDRGEGSAAWKKMQNILAQIRLTGLAPVAKVEVKKVEKKEETPAPAPVPVAPIVETKAVVPMTLEAKVLDYINKHPKGVKISEMEEPLGETRMKLGFVAKTLLDVGTAQKIDNMYFPIK